MTTGTLEAPVAPAAPDRPAALRTGAWRVATRLARREVRRRWGRTLLVMILVAVPVFGMTVVTVLVRTSRGTAAGEFTRQFGAADLAAVGTAPAPPGGWPAGTRFARGRTITDVGVVADDGTARLTSITDIDLTNPVTRGSVLLRAGRFPSRAGEALISPKLARAFGVGVGDVLRLAEPPMTERVVGIGVRATNWSEGFLAVRGDELSRGRFQFAVDQVDHVTLVALAGHPSAAEIRRDAMLGYRDRLDTGPQGASAAVDWTLVAGVIALAVSGVVISGAFAVGARRQLVTLGQLSANGADESLLRRMLSLQGAWCGVLGVAAGLGAATATLLSMHTRFDGWVHRDIGPYLWSMRDLAAIVITGVVTATLAAFVPARSAARVPVLSALAGRRPLGAVRRSLVPIGVALFGFGVLLLALVATASRQSSGGNGLAATAVLGGLLVLAGACCVSPAVVASLAVLGARLRGAGRVALRSIVRTRARSAAVVMALAAINAGAIAVATAFASSTTKVGSSPFMRTDSLIVARQTDVAGVDGISSSFAPIPAPLESALRRIVPHATWYARRAVLDVQLRDAGGIGVATDGKRLVALAQGNLAFVADPPLLRLVGLAPSDAATLQRDGVLFLQPDFGPGSGPVAASYPVTFGTGSTARTVDVRVAKHAVHATAGIVTLITPAKARALGLTTVPAGEIVRNPTTFDESQRASIDALAGSTFALAGPAAPPLKPGSPDVGATRSAAPGSFTTTEILWTNPNTGSVGQHTVEQIILAIVVAVALLVLAMSLALSAAETRDERDVLVSLGARPATLRGVAAWKAALLAATGALIAVPTGFIPVAVVYVAAVHSDERAHLSFPWSSALELVVAAPILAALVAAIGSGIAQRVRPTQMSTFATD